MPVASSFTSVPPNSAQSSSPPWKALGNPPGSKGYKYKGAASPGDPCKVVLLKGTVIKAVCKGAGITLTPPFTGDVGIARGRSGNAMRHSTSVAERNAGSRLPKQRAWQRGSCCATSTT